MLGDELRLKHQQTVDGEWSCVGSVIKIPDSEFSVQIYIASLMFWIFSGSFSFSRKQFCEIFFFPP